MTKAGRRSCGNFDKVIIGIGINRCVNLADQLGP